MSALLIYVLAGCVVDAMGMKAERDILRITPHGLLVSLLVITFWPGVFAYRAPKGGWKVKQEKTK